MLSVQCMLNQNDYSRDKMPTCPPIITTSVHHHRSPMLDIASLLCHNNDNDDLYNASRTTTPSLSVVSSPLSTSSSMSFTSSLTSINSIPSSPTTPSTRSPPLAYHRKYSSYENDHYTKPVFYVPSASYPSRQQQPQSNSAYHYQHRLLLFVDDDDDDGAHKKWRPLARNKHTDCNMTDDEGDDDDDDDESNDKRIKSKRRRANSKQLQVLNRVFQHTFFPSTQVRAQLGRQLGMSPRTVQIWFQNRRQALRTKERQRRLD